jgi:putative transcriptional regulator
MSEENTVVFRRLPDGTSLQVMADGTTRPYVSKTDWARHDAMTEEEIEANPLSDPDNPPLTDEELAEMWSPYEARQMRTRLNMTQEEFSEKFQIPLGTLRDWERGASIPDKSARTLLRVIAREPEAVLWALAG